MTFTEATKTCLSKYADFNGRASRSEYWWFVLFTIIVSIVLSFVSNTLSGLFSLGMLLPSIAAATRRLHDTNRSGWMQLIGIVPVLGWIAIIYFLAQPGTAASRFDSVKAVSEAA